MIVWQKEQKQYLSMPQMKMLKLLDLNLKKILLQIEIITIQLQIPILVSDGNEQYRQVRFNIPKTDISVEEALKVAKIIEVAETKADKNNEEVVSYIDFDYYTE